MAPISTTPTRADVGIFRDWLADRIQGIRTAFAQRRTYRRTLDELHSLGDRELDDLGIYRGDLRRIAHEAAYGAH